MSNSSENKIRRQSHSILACYPCRKRKIKCGRELSQCLICTETSQICVYPTKAERPGPKIGSTHARPSNRRLARRCNDEQRTSKAQGLAMHSSKPENATDISSPISSSQSLSTQSPPAQSTLSLSFILHPSFETCSLDQSKGDSACSKSASRYGECLIVSCRSLGMTVSQLDRMLPRYFEIFTSFQLFHIPTWQTKLQRIPSSSQRTALLAAMLAWALKGLDHDDVNILGEGRILKESAEAPSIHFRAISLKYMEEAMTECWDEPLSLPLLQALILNTHCLLVQGVRGRAWRYLGLCIRSAYELNLHLIDAEERYSQKQVADVDRWCLEEEWRRAWWAIWEMDVYASVIRRCPAGIDWTQNDTFLPVEDEKWFRGEPQQSCPLELNSVARWKTLAATNNKSPKAWFIVINSLMKEAQKISSPVSIDKMGSLDFAGPNGPGSTSISGLPRSVAQQHESINRLSALLNSLHCSLMALPTEFKYNGQFLNFRADNKDFPNAGNLNLRNSSIYSIYVMAQFTKMMVLKYHIFRAGWKWTFENSPSSIDKTTNDLEDPLASATSPTLAIAETQHLTQYFEAADNVLSIIRCTSEDHYKYVNPFLASATWLVGALQLLHRGLLLDDCSEKDLLNSNFELVCLLYQRFVDYWNMSKIPLKNWETLESGLEDIRDNVEGDTKFRYETPCIFTGGNFGHRPPIYPSYKERSSGIASYKPQIAEPTAEMAQQLDQSQLSSWGLRSNANIENISTEYHSISYNSNIVMADNNASNGALSYQNDSSNTEEQYTFPFISCLDNQSERQEPVNIISVAGTLGSEQVSSSVSTRFQAIPSPDALDSIPCTYDWAVNTNFSDYLDEVLSGSYLP